MQFTVYILFSPSKYKYYIGYTGDDINEGIRKHNTDHSGFTGGMGDCQICYTENFTTKAEAIKRENQIKK